LKAAVLSMVGQPALLARRLRTSSKKPKVSNSSAAALAMPRDCR